MKAYFAFVALLVGLASLPVRGKQDESRRLFSGDQFQREIRVGQLHRYRVQLESDQLLNLPVTQQGIDVIITIYHPNGQQAAVVDSPIGAKGVEPVLFIAPTSGEYQVTIRAEKQTAQQGQYEIKVLAIAQASARDKIYVAAKTGTAKAEETRNKFTVESLRQAKELYQHAIALWKEYGDAKEEAYATHGLGRTQEALSEYPAAIETYSRAVPLWQQAKDAQGEGMTLSNLGLVYSFQSDYARALECYERALPLRRAAQDYEGETYTLLSFATSYAALGETEKGIALVEQALTTARKLQHTRLQGIALYNLALLMQRQNNLQKALDLQREALTFRQQIPNKNERAVTLNHLGELYYQLGDQAAALRYLNEALEVVRASGNRESEIRILLSFGLMNLRQRNQAQANEYFTQSLQLARSTGTRSQEGLATAYLGDAAAANGEYAQALQFYQQALQIFRAIGHRQFESDVLGKIGQVQLLLKQYDQAALQFDAALQLSRALQYRDAEVNVLFALAQVEMAQGKFDTAQARLESALEMVEQVRRSLRLNDSRATFWASRREIASAYVDLLMRQQAKGVADANTRALLASEQFRAQSLRDLLLETRAEIQDQRTPALLGQERSLQQKISDKSEVVTALLNKRLPAERTAAQEKELAALVEQLRELRATIRAQNPHYAALTQPQPLSLKEIQHLLDTDTVLLEYLLGKERSYLWVVTPTSLSSYELPARADIESLARRVNDLFTRSSERAVRGPAQLAAAELSQLVLGPAANQITGKRLLIVSDGALQYVPFAALPEPVVGGNGTSGSDRRNRTTALTTDHLPSLIVNHEIVSLPSASVLPLLRQETKAARPTDNTIAIIADPVFEMQDQRLAQAKSTSMLLAANAPKGFADLTRSGNETGMLSFARLPYTRQEADAIYGLTTPAHSLKALDFQASRATVISANLAAYRILHFATHGLLNSQHPELSGLVLSLVDEKGQPQDGFFRLHDIYNLRLRADLVVLSACRTALGKEINGEGLLGLTRGFMYAGAKSVIASVWDVKDEATAELMKRFYQNLLQKGQRPAAALRAAQISIQQESRWAAPYFWAGFTMQGEWW